MAMMAKFQRWADLGPACFILLQESLLLRIPNMKQSEMQIRFLPEMGKPTRMNTFVSRM